MSRSRLVRMFAQQTGMSPKQFASLSRFQRAVRSLAAGEDDLAQLALACGYFDQSHFCHEFRRFSGRAPTAYRPRDPREPNHVLD
jgi:AraC-like DNA-binding protein